MQNRETRNRPIPGDYYVACDESGYWSIALCFVEPVSETVGLLMDNAGELFECPFTDLLRASVTTPGDEVAEQESDARRDCQYYNQRSRVTAQQRANATLTSKQRIYLFGLAKRRGMTTDDLRAATPQGSISKLTVREAATLIDRLKGKAKARAAN